MGNRNREKGFTLLEVLIAMAIIGVGLIALVTLFPVGLRSSRLAGDFTTASFVAQQALDNIRAAAQVYDPADLVDETGDGNLFNDTNRNDLGYYELPVSAVKGHVTNILFPNLPDRSQSWTITMTTDHDPSGAAGTFSVASDIHGTQTNTGIIGVLYQSDNNDARFLISDNVEGAFDYDEFAAGDEIVINVEMHSGVPYYWYAMRAPMTEDIDLDGVLDGPGQAYPNNQVDEDTGLDLLPDYWDKNNSQSYQAGLDTVGETGFTGTNDPHGDNRYVHNAAPPPKWDTSSQVNPNGTEGNGQIDAFDDDDIQKVTVVVGWREGGQDRTATFSTAIANQFR